MYFLMLFIFYCFSFGLAEAAQKNAENKVPTTIKSDRMEYNAEQQQVIFLGNVYVKRPDFELWSEKMTVYLEDSGQTNSSAATEGMEAGDIDKIIAEKNVRLKSNDKSGTCQTATYFAKQDKLVLSGSPVLHNGNGDTVFGNEIHHYPATNRSQVMRGGVTFYATDKHGSEKVENGPSLLSPK